MFGGYADGLAVKAGQTASPWRRLLESLCKMRIMAIMASAVRGARSTSKCPPGLHGLRPCG